MSKTEKAETAEAVRDWFVNNVRSPGCPTGIDLTEFDELLEANRVAHSTRIDDLDGVDLSQFDGLLNGEAAAKNPLDRGEEEYAVAANWTRNTWIRWITAIDDVIWPERDVMMGIVRQIPFTQIEGCAPVIVPFVEHYLRETVKAKTKELDADELCSMLNEARLSELTLKTAERWNTIIDELDSGKAADELHTAYKEEFADVAASYYTGHDAKEAPPQEPKT